MTLLWVINVLFPHVEQHNLHLQFVEWFRLPHCCQWYRNNRAVTNFRCEKNDVDLIFIYSYRKNTTYNPTLLNRLSVSGWINKLMAVQSRATLPGEYVKNKSLKVWRVRFTAEIRMSKSRIMYLLFLYWRQGQECRGRNGFLIDFSNFNFLIHREVRGQDVSTCKRTLIPLFVKMICRQI